VQRTDGVDGTDKLRLARRITKAVWLFNPAEDATAFANELRHQRTRMHDDEKDTDSLLTDLVSARHKPSLVLYELSCAINDMPFDTVQRSTMDTAVSHLSDALGDCERIFHSPVPVVYTRFAARFVELFMLFVPLALYDEFGGYWNHWPL